jgi:site-specific DNA-adenine methylase
MNTSPLRTLGNKAKLMPLLVNYFPNGISVFIDMFARSLECSFYMIKHFPKIKVFASDNDSNVSNLWNLIFNENIQQRNKDVSQLLELIECTGINQNVWELCKENKFETNIYKAFSFLYLSNFGYMGKPETLLHDTQDNGIEILIKSIKDILKFYADKITFIHPDFIDISLPMRDRMKQYYNQFVFCDPPYLNKGNNYEDKDWNEIKLRALIEKNIKSGLKFGICEFWNNETDKIFNEYNLNINLVSERVNLKTRDTGIFATNYKPEKLLFEI